MDSVRRSKSAKYECLLFDMDDTLYPMSSGINLACRKNIEGFMLQHLHMEETEVPRLCFDLYKEYGTTMAGLKALGYEFDNDEFHAYVHGRLPYDVLKPDPTLRNLLLSMPQRKLIFTNADKAHAAQVLSRLGLEDCFEGIICFETLNPPLEPVSNCMDMPDGDDAVITEGAEAYVPDCANLSSYSRVLCKPSVEAIEAAIQIANIDPKKTETCVEERMVEPSGPIRRCKSGVVDHDTVLRAMARALERTEEDYMEMVEKALDKNPELALMGSCVLVMLMKDQDVYVMNLGDSRVILAQERPNDRYPNPNFLKDDMRYRNRSRESLVKASQLRRPVRTQFSI